MACKLDVRDSILNKVMDELVAGRYTFTRTGVDTIQINSGERAKSGNQANAIAKELISRANSSFYGHVTGYVNQVSSYDPITVTFRVSDAYINHVYNNLPESQKSIGAEITNNERNHINTNTGHNTYDQLTMFSPEVDAAGAFVKFIQFKKSQLYEYQKRLNRIEAEQKKKDITTEQLTKLKNIEREIKLQIDGAEELGITGIRTEILELEKKADINAVGFYAEKDLQRLDKLAKSNDIDDINEAQRIVDFYDLAGSFRRNQENPFFTQEEIFLADDNGNLNY
jgi:hypothetical protein